MTVGGVMLIAPWFSGPWRRRRSGPGRSVPDCGTLARRQRYPDGHGPPRARLTAAPRRAISRRMIEEAMGIEAALAELAERVPQWLTAGTWLSLVLVAALLGHWALYRSLRGVTGQTDSAIGSLLRRARRPLRLVFLLAALSLAIPRIAMPFGWQAWLGQLALILFLVILGWTAIVLINHFSERAIRRYRIDTPDNLAARKYLTQLRLLRRAANVVIGILTAGAVLLTFESVRQYGVSLLASAGAAGLVLALAARPVLENLVAGVQIALTQPIRLDDVVIVEGEWGVIEDITATYVVVRVWDWRRVIVPLKRFIDQPFQNWTRESASIIGAVTWHVDYTVPLADLRAKLEELVRAAPLWDGQVVNMQVTEAGPETLTVRGLMSARTSPEAWDLRCAIREQLIAWLQAEYPGALPRRRAEIDLHETGPRAG
jgi:small-conductance mechanosensitive channel